MGVPDLCSVIIAKDTIMKTKIYKKFILTTLMAAVFTTLAFSQTLTQVVRGTIVDVDSKLPLPGSTLVISNGITGVREMWGNMPAYVVSLICY